MVPRQVRGRVLGSGVWAPARKGRSWGPLPVRWAPSPCPAHLVVVLLHEAAQRQAKALVRPHAPVHGVDGPGRFILIDLLPFAVQGHGGCGGAAVRARSAAGCGGRGASQAGSRAWDLRVRREAGPRVGRDGRARKRGLSDRQRQTTTAAGSDPQFQTCSGSDDNHLPFETLPRPPGTEATRSPQWRRALAARHVT